MLVLSQHPVIRAVAKAADSGEAALIEVGPLNFTPINLSSADKIEVAPGYTSRVLIRWGDPLFHHSPEWNPSTMTASAQESQFGYNNDFVGYIPRGENGGVLIVNHEYTNPDLMFPGYSAANPTREQVDVELAAHGLTVVYLERHKTLGWRYIMNAAVNRRITGTTKMMLTGPAAGNAALKTTGDPTGYFVAGTLNNCSAGITPWGTVLTCEENFNQYFANNDRNPDPKSKAAHARYGLTAAASERKWERFYDRFDASREPNEAYRFGWVVEIDPNDPASLPKKRTALGRIKHEATSTVLTADGRVAVYMGDDERFDYMYKFVSAQKMVPGSIEENATLLDSGVLHVAKFSDNGTGAWIPLVHGQGALTVANGFADQADILIRTRLAADAAGATKMDRPEDFEVNPANGKVYIALTNNTRRGAAGQPGTDNANPRANNIHGHVLELSTANGDHGTTTFSWRLFIACGVPGTDPGTYYGGFDQAKISPLSSPDNITFDKGGNLWIATDGQINTLRKNDGVYAVAVDGPERGHAKQFFSGVPGGECASLCFDDRDETLFVTIQHPGEDSPFDKPSSTFPDRKQPRPSVVLVMKDGGGRIGS
jgi:secreted PhoX family phosphatase